MAGLSPGKRKPGYKLVLLGEASVGKSSIVQRFVRNKFTDSIETTVGAAFSTREVRVEDKDYKLEIWDTAGQERFRSLAPMYYRNAAGAIVTYDLTSRESFERAKAWLKQLEDQGCDAVVLLAGNKLDLASNREVTTSEGQALADSKRCIFVECSAKTGEHVYTVFERLARNLPDPNAVKAASLANLETVSLNPDAGAGGGCGC